MELMSGEEGSEGEEDEGLEGGEEEDGSELEEGDEEMGSSSGEDEGDEGEAALERGDGAGGAAAAGTSGRGGPERAGAAAKKGGKRQPAAAEDSIQTLKRKLREQQAKKEASEKAPEAPPLETLKFLTQEDYERIRELKHKYVFHANWLQKFRARSKLRTPCARIEVIWNP